MYISRHYIVGVIGIVALCAGSLGFTTLNPWGSAIQKDFEYTADVISVDNVFDEELNDFSGEERSATTLKYKTVEQIDETSLIKNIFDVRTIEGGQVFSVERLYGVNTWTGEHVASSGDRGRNGYFFAPSGLAVGEGYTYWHVNYDMPIAMKYVGREKIEGLTVFRYASQGLIADQTENLTHLPGVPDERGVRLFVNLNTWIEPVSGYLVAYTDKAEAVFYDQESGDVLNPWNSFRNQFTRSSIQKHVELAKLQKSRLILGRWVFPLGLLIIGLITMIYAFIFRQSYDRP